MEALAWHHPARNRLCLESSPAAERATGELPPGTSSLSVAELRPSALPGSLPCIAGFLPALPARMCRRSWWLRNPLSSPSGTVGPSHRRSPHSPEIPAAPAQCEVGERAILTFAWPSIRVSRLLVPNVLHWARKKEEKKVRSDASAARPEDQRWARTKPRQESHSRHGGGSAPSPGV